METFEFKSNGKFFVSVDDYNVKIESKGMSNFINRGSKGVKSIPIKSITAIQFKKPNLTTGYIQFAYSGSSESKGGTLNAVKDENTILFIKKELDLAEKLVELIEVKRREDTKPSTQTQSTADEIKQFKSLLDEGIITQEEFDSKKKQLLGI